MTAMASTPTHARPATRFHADLGDRQEPLVPAELGRIEFSWRKSLWLYAMLVPALIWGRRSVVSWSFACSAILTFVTVCMGHSVGLHRGVIHRTYRCSRWVRNLLLYLFVHTGLGGPLSWIRLHYVRDYFQNAASCPMYFGYRQSVFRDYFWNLHLAFVPKDDSVFGIPAELVEDRWIRFLERTWALHVAGLVALVWLFFGFEAAVVIVFVRVAVTILGHWFVGFVAHKHGYVRYELDGSPEIGRNTWLLGVLSFGEGFHNNHHANPGSAAMGEAWYELDLGFLVVRLCELLGLFRDVRASTRGHPTLRHNARRATVVARFTAM
jgi:stearoyl-CoA desaturase (delta-9 desaturase)